jgi:hypothetical protein
VLKELKNLPPHVQTYPAFLLRLDSQHNVIVIGDCGDNGEHLVRLHRRLRALLWTTLTSLGDPASQSCR